LPIGRFLHDLKREGKDESYLAVLREAFNAETIGPLMCRHQIHVGWDGTLHDCDFNFALAMATSAAGPRHIRDFDVAALRNRAVVTGDVPDGALVAGVPAKVVGEATT